MGKLHVSAVCLKSVLQNDGDSCYSLLAGSNLYPYPTTVLMKFNPSSYAAVFFLT